MAYCDHLLSVVRPSTPLNDFSETPGPIVFKLHVEPSVEVCVCVRGGGGEGFEIFYKLSRSVMA